VEELEQNLPLAQEGGIPKLMIRGDHTVKFVWDTL
jgi:hypothetical protein